MDRASLQAMGDNALALVPRARRPRPRAAGAARRRRRHLLPGARASWSATRAARSGRWPARRLLAVVAPGCSWSRRPRASARCRRTAGRPPRLAAAAARRSAPLAAQGLWSLLVADPPGLRRDARPVAARLVPAGRRRRSSSRSSCSGTRCCAAGSAPRRWPSARWSGWRVLGAVLAALRARRLLPGRAGRRWPARSRASSRALTGNRAVRPGRRAGRRRGRRGGARADRRRCSSRRSACAPAAVRRLRRRPARRRAAARVRAAVPRRRTPPDRGWLSSAVVPGRRPGPRGGLRRRRAVGRPLRRRPPGAQPAGLRAGPRHRPGVVGQHRDAPGRLHRAVRRRPRHAARSTSRTWPGTTCAPATRSRRTCRPRR